MALPDDRMPPAQRYTVYAVFGALWFSGCAWLILHQFFAKADQFGNIRHPWEPKTLLLHGVVAIAATYLLGWVAARHVAQAWRSANRRLSGGSYSSCIAVLVLSGFALFFLTDDRWQQNAALAHEILGVAFAFCAIQHWCFGRRMRVG
jgi:hypothetical protein